MQKYILRIAALAAAVMFTLCGCVDISDSESVPAMKQTEPAAEETSHTAAQSQNGIYLISPDDVPVTAAPITEAPYAMPDIAELRQRLDAIREENGVYGMGIAVFRGGDIIYTEGFGLADTDSGRKCDRSTHFRAASVSKLISTILVMRLCDEELITPESLLDDAVGLPYSAAGNNDVKLWHLLTHTAGITDTYLYEQGASLRYDVGYVLKNSITGIAPGTFYNYTNFGAGTMGALIECLTGRFFHDYARETLFEPLGMDAGYIIDQIEDKESCAVIYDHDGVVYNVSEWDRDREYYESFGLGNSYLEAQGELLITPADLARLGTALAGDGTIRECGGKRVISEKSLEQMHNTYIETDNFGMGLNVRKYSGTLVPGREMYGHPGNALGAITGIFYDRSDRTGVVILTNRSNYFLDEKTGLYRTLTDTVREIYDSFFSETAGDP